VYARAALKVSQYGTLTGQRKYHRLASMSKMELLHEIIGESLIG
jgi:hypothetical protein